MYKLILILLSILLSKGVLSQIDGYVAIKQDTTFDSDGFDIMDAFISDKKVIITGENHRYRGSNGIIKLKMLMYLYEKGFRYFLLELGAGTGYLANDYVTTGNENAISILERNFQSQNGLYELFDAIRRFNESRPYEEMIKIEGVDLTRFPIYSTKALSLIILDVGCEEELSDYYEDLMVVSSSREDINPLGFISRQEPDEDFNIKADFKTYRNRIYELSIKNLVADFYRDTNRFQLALGQKYQPFKKIIDELDATLKWYKGEGLSIQSHVQRERHLESRIAAIFKADSSAKVFGQFGRCHIRSSKYDQECYAFDMDAVANRLEERNALKDRVGVIPIFYKEQREVRLSKNTDYNAAFLLPRSASFIYDTRTNLLALDIAAEMRVSNFVIINTFSDQVTMNDIVSNDFDKRLKKNQNYYRGNKSESYIAPIYQYAFLTHELNQSIGVDLVPRNLNYFGISFREVMPNGGQSIVKVSGVNPTGIVTDSVNFRYSNWRFESSAGYNFIYRKPFSMYFDLGLFFGFSKIIEDRPNESVDFSNPVFSERVEYRNHYLGLTGNIGMKFKLGRFALLVEAGYQRDFTDPNWEYKSVEVPGIEPLDYSLFMLTGGIAISLN